MDTDEEILLILKKIYGEIKYVRDKIDLIERETEEISEKTS